MNLYTISNEYQELLNKDEYTAEDLEKLESLNDDFKQKAINVAAYIKNLESLDDQIHSAIDSMNLRLSKVRTKAKNLRDYLLQHLQKCNIEKIEDHPEFTVKVKRNPARVVVTNEPSIPTEYFVELRSVRLDKDKLKKAIQGGINIEGAHIEQGVRVDIE